MIRATVKGNIAVAVTQGALGGVIFWILGIQGALLWAVLMAFLSLLPAVGAGLIWLPVAIYFLATGNIWQGVILVAFGVLVIGLVDNVLRPLLVGKDTKMPDYVVLISTLGGLSLFGINGFVIGPLIAAMFIATWALFAARDEDPAVGWQPVQGAPQAGSLVDASGRPIAASDDIDEAPPVEQARRDAEAEAQEARREAQATAAEVEIARDVAQKAAEEARAAEEAADRAKQRATRPDEPGGAPDKAAAGSGGAPLRPANG